MKEFELKEYIYLFMPRTIKHLTQQMQGKRMRVK